VKSTGIVGTFTAKVAGVLRDEGVIAVDYHCHEFPIFPFPASLGYANT
jgi:hypothetical protein